MICLLEPDHYLGPIQRVPLGAHFVHTAQIDFAGEVREAYVKVYPPGFGGLIGEAVGYLAAAHAQVPCPRRAAVMQIRARDMAGLTLPTWALQADEPLWAWCTEAVPGRSLQMLVAGPVTPSQLWLNVLHSKSGAALAYLDEWLANKDRNEGALVRTPEGTWHAIDFGEAFGGALLWPEFGPQEAGRGELYRQAMTLLPDQHRAAFRSRICEMGGTLAGFSDTLQRPILHLARCINIKQHATDLAPFLRDREGAQWAADRAKLLL